MQHTVGFAAGAGSDRALRYTGRVEPPNWFIGFPVKGAAFLAGLAPPANVRLFAAEDLHITLAFLGKVGETRASAAFAQAADGSARERSALHLGSGPQPRTVRTRL